MSASVLAALQRMHLFRSLNTSELERIVGSCSIVTLSSGQVHHLPAFPAKPIQNAGVSPALLKGLEHPSLVSQVL